MVLSCFALSPRYVMKYATWWDFYRSATLCSLRVPSDKVKEKRRNKEENFNPGCNHWCCTTLLFIFSLWNSVSFLYFLILLYWHPYQFLLMALVAFSFMRWIINLDNFIRSCNTILCKQTLRVIINYINLFTELIIF